MDTAKLNGHFIIGGFGHLGQRIAEYLRQADHPVLVIDKEPPQTACRQLADLGCHLLEGDITNQETLLQAGILHARAFLAVTGDDRSNLEAAITARQCAASTRTIVRLYDDTLAQHTERVFGFEAFSASFLASPAFVAAATDESIIAVFRVGESNLCLYQGELVAEKKNGLLIAKRGPALSHVKLDTPTAESDQLLYICRHAPDQEATRPKTRRRSGKFLPQLAAAFSSLHPKRLLRGLGDIWNHSAAITRSLLVALCVSVLLSVIVFTVFAHLSLLDALYFVITTMTTTGYGDINLQQAPPLLKLYGILMMCAGATLLATLYAIISDYVLAARLEYLLGRRAVNLHGHTVIIGLGRVGYRVACDLHSLGLDLVAIEIAEDSDNVSAARAHFPVILGNAARSSILQKSGIEYAATLLALTDDPMLNLSAALHARERNPNIKTILRTYDAQLSEKLAVFKFDAVFSTSAIAAPIFADAALTPGVEGSFRLEGDELLVIKHMVTGNSFLAGKTVAEIGEEQGIAVLLAACDTKPQDYDLVSQDCIMKDGMKVVLLVTREKLHVLKQ
jgi:Trk K+ transport system NAD-binding subunit